MRRKNIDSGLSKIKAGSPESGEPAFLAVGKIRKPHGVQGEVEMEIFTDFPERILPGKILTPSALKAI